MRRTRRVRFDAVHHGRFLARCRTDLRMTGPRAALLRGSTKLQVSHCAMPWFLGGDLRFHHGMSATIRQNP
jgi:hypothetical protein